MMPRQSVTIRALLILSLASADSSVHAQSSVTLADVRTIRRSFSGAIENGRFVADGRWVRTTEPQRASLASLNAVQIACSRAEGRCTEALANLHSTLDPKYREMYRGKDPGALLAVDMTEFRVIEWSHTAIRAQAQPRAADIELRISPVEKTVVRIATETSARGASGANPIPEVWKLE